MGLHSGPVYKIADINANQNVAGGGINIAQRVMDCGDAGHILASRSVADVLGQLSNWKETACTICAKLRLSMEFAFISTTFIRTIQAMLGYRRNCKWRRKRSPRCAPRPRGRNLLLD